MKSSVRRILVGKLIGLIPLLLLISCSETEDTKVEATFSSLWDNRFSSCGNVTCHNSIADDGTQYGPNLGSKTEFYNNLIDRSIDQHYPDWANLGGKTGCNSQNFIDPGNANASTLAGSLIQTVSDSMKAAFNCDTSYSVHEVGKVVITNQELKDALVTWINEGATNN